MTKKATKFWYSPLNKELSNRDPISILLKRGDLDVLRRALDVAMSHLDEGRENEERISFARRLARIWTTCGSAGRGNTTDVVLTIVRDDIDALHQVIHVAAGHMDETEMRGKGFRLGLIHRLARITAAACNAVYDHDDVPPAERGDP